MSFKNRSEALEFLKKHPILPSEEDIADKEYELYSDIIKFFIKNPDKECIPLIVNSHRHNSSPFFEQGFTDLLLKQDETAVRTHIITALESEDPGLRESGIFFAGELPSDEFIKPLTEILRDDGSSDEMADGAVKALKNIDEEYEGLGIDSIIDVEFRQNPRWKHLLKKQSDIEFRLSFIGVNWDASQALENGDYAAVIEMLEPYDGECPEAVQKKLDTARKMLKDS